MLPSFLRRHRITEAGEHLRKVLRKNQDLRLGNPVRGPDQRIGHV